MITLTTASIMAGGVLSIFLIPIPFIIVVEIVRYFLVYNE